MADASRLTRPDWERELHALLPLYGHRNWIVVADSAYPAQSKPGIETIVSGADQIEVVRKVLDAINASRHVRANVYLDKELGFVPETDAPGVTAYRKQLDAMLWRLEQRHAATRADHRQARPGFTGLSRAHHQDGTDDSLHLRLLRTRLRATGPPMRKSACARRWRLRAQE